MIPHQNLVNQDNYVKPNYDVIQKELYIKLQTWYVCSIVKSTLPNMTWETPFGHYYGNDTENLGKYFSRDIKVFYDDLIKKSDYRTSGTHYKDILRGYQHILTEDEDALYYTKIKPLIAILESESYLRLSQDLEIRALYLSCQAEITRLYNRYMTVVR